MEIKQTDFYEVHFSEKPSRMMINNLKRHGLVWHIKRKCWVRSPTEHSLKVLEMFTLDIIKDSLINYRDHHVKPDLFLEAVLTNDLYATVVRANFIDADRIASIVRMVNDLLPLHIWGSLEECQKHLIKKGQYDLLR